MSAALAAGPLPARFSDLYETEADYARALVRYACQDGLGLSVQAGRLIISIGSKSDADLLGELRARESAVIACLRKGGATSVDLSNPARAAEPFWPRIVRVAPFGCDTMPDRFKSAWEAFTARCPTGVRPILWQAAVTDAADLFGHWGLQLVAQGFMPGHLFDVPNNGKQGGLCWFTNVRRQLCNPSR
jgi:hypothetical protein